MQSVSGGGYLLNKSLANYQETKTFNVIEGTVKYTGGLGDLYVASYIDGVQISGSFPDKLAYKFDRAECNNGAEIIFDNATWTATTSNINSAKTKCNVYFITREQTELISNKIKYFAESDTANLLYDGTVEDSNLRYIGANPNNYVSFNDELWRIIGVFKDINNGSGIKEWRTKIIRNASIGNKAWDAGNTCGWTNADINNELNSSYLNGLSTEAQGMIGNTKWAINKAASGITAANYYSQERGGATWTGKIGLMYPSDYGYAVGGGSRTTCLNYTMDTWSNHSECLSNNWLFNNTNVWTLTPCIITIFSSGSVNMIPPGNELGIRPTLYLSNNVQITGGSGTSTDPFILSV